MSLSMSSTSSLSAAADGTNLWGVGQSDSLLTLVVLVVPLDPLHHFLLFWLEVTLQSLLYYP